MKTQSKAWALLSAILIAVLGGELVLAQTTVSQTEIFLPLFPSGNFTIQASNSEPTNSIATDAYGSTVTPFDELPVCTDEMIDKIDWENLPPPDFNTSDPGCRAISRRVEVGNGPIAIPVSSNNLLPIRSGEVHASQVMASAKAYAINRIDCTSSCTSNNGIKRIGANFSAKKTNHQQW